MNAKAGIGIALLLLVTSAAAAMTVACGDDNNKPPATPSAVATPPPPATTSSGAVMPSATASAPVATASAAPLPAPPTAKGKFTSFAVSAQSGKIDKIGAKDGVFKPDGVKDFVFDAELEGPANALLLVSTDASGQPNGEFNADTLVGDQQLPSELAANLNEGKFTGGLAVYEGDKLLNNKEGGLPMLSDGKHKLVLHISSKDAPKGSYKALATFDNKSMTASSPAATK